MFRLLNKRALAVCLLAFAVGACDDEVTPITPTPVNPVTETFSGTVAVNGAAVHSFSTVTGGAVRATLQAIGTDNTLVVGLLLGNWNSTAGTCSVVLANEQATGGSVLQGTMTSVGSLCVRVYDVGNVTGAPVPYSIEVVHP